MVYIGTGITITGNPCTGSGISPPPPERVTPMSSILASAQFDFEATSASSYDGSAGAWTSLINAGGYALYRGTSSGADTADPTFNGSADDEAAYWSFDSGDRFSLPANTSFLDSLHKTTGGTPFWLAFAFRTPVAASGGAESRLFNTRVSGRGVSVWFNLHSATNPSVSFHQEGDSAEVSYASNSSGVNLTFNADNIAILSSDGSNLKMWVNADTANVNTPLAFNATANTAEFDLTLCNNIYNARGMPTGFRLYHTSAGDELLDDAKAQSIIAEIKKRYPSRSFV